MQQVRREDEEAMTSPLARKKETSKKEKKLKFCSLLWSSMPLERLVIQNYQPNGLLTQMFPPKSPQVTFGKPTCLPKSR